jgi:hypothetical protein
MKSSILRAGVVALACALGLSACGGGSGDLNLTGNVYNVTKDGLVLTNNGGDDTKVVSPYTSFVFNTRVSSDDSFNIEVKDVPSNVEKKSDCVVSNGKGRANYYSIAQVRVDCKIRQRALTVLVNGLTKDGLVIVNGTDSKAVAAGTTRVDMPKVNEDASYGVTVLTQPAPQTCSVTGGDTSKGPGNGSGIMGATENTIVTVTCQ